MVAKQQVSKEDKAQEEKKPLLNFEVRGYGRWGQRALDRQVGLLE